MVLLKTEPRVNGLPYAKSLCLIPDNIDDVSAAGIPVACLTAQVALTPGRSSGGQDCSGAGERRINRQCGDAIGARLGLKMKSSIHRSRSWVMACVESRRVTAQTLSSTESVVTC